MCINFVRFQAEHVKILTWFARYKPLVRSWAPSCTGRTVQVYGTYGTVRDVVRQGCRSGVVRSAHPRRRWHDSGGRWRSRRWCVFTIAFWYGMAERECKATNNATGP